MDDRSSPPPAPPMMSSAPAARANMAPAKRPNGVTFLAALYIIVATFVVLFYGMMFTAGGGAMSMMEGETLASVMMIGSVLFAVLAGVTGWGLWSRLRWAWYAAVVLQVISIATGILSLPSGILWLFIAGYLTWYLLTPAVQRWFGVWYDVPWNKGAKA